MWIRLGMALTLLLAVSYAAWLVLEIMRPDVDSAVILVDRPAIEVELARLSALPVPGVEAEEVPPMGELAEAAAACLGETARKPTPDRRAAAGVMAYMLVLGAVGAHPETPLLEPRFQALAPLFARGPRAVREAAAEGELSPEQAALLADFHATYAQVKHPLYTGLDLYEQTFPALEFQSLMGTLAASWAEVADCAFARALPPEPEAADGEPGADGSGG